MFSALFSKLWRLIRLLGTGFRRFLLKEKDVIRPAANMFILNIIILICWTVISPLQWERVSVDSIQLWNTVGVCANENGAVEKSCWIAIGCINKSFHVGKHTKREIILINYLRQKESDLPRSLGSSSR